VHRIANLKLKILDLISGFLIFKMMFFNFRF
jgi:hypothetical protein